MWVGSGKSGWVWTVEERARLLAAEHEADHGDGDHGLGDFGQDFIVLG